MKKIVLVAVGLAALLLCTTAAAETVAERCNNPCSIKRCYDGQCWLGQRGVDRHGHVKFATVRHGVRAAAVTLRTYSKKHRICTVNGVLQRYCPGASKEYRQFIANRLKVKPNQKINIEKRLAELLAAIALYESGKALPSHLLEPYK